MQIVSPTFGLGNEQVVLSPEEAEGIVVIYPYFQELDNPTNRAWVQAWHDRYGADYTYITTPPAPCGTAGASGPWRLTELALRSSASQ